MLEKITIALLLVFICKTTIPQKKAEIEKKDNSSPISKVKTCPLQF